MVVLIQQFKRKDIDVEHQKKGRATEGAPYPQICSRPLQKSNVTKSSRNIKHTHIISE